MISQAPVGSIDMDKHMFLAFWNQGREEGWFCPSSVSPGNLDDKIDFREGYNPEEGGGERGKGGGGGGREGRIDAPSCFKLGNWS